MPNSIPSQDELKVLGARLRPLIQSGKDAKGDLPDTRWAKTEAFYDDAPPGGEDADSRITNVHVTFSSIRSKALKSLICGVVAKQEPYMIAKEYQSGDRAERLEKVVHFFWERSDFEKLLRKACTIAINTNKAIWKLSYVNFDSDNPEDGGIVLEVIHPDNWICVPALPDGIKVAKMCGNRFWRRRRWIKEGVMAKEFLEAPNKDSEVASTMESADQTRAMMRSRSNADTPSPEHDDDLIEIWDLTIKLDTSNLSGQSTDNPKAEKWCRVLLAVDSDHVLDYKELPYSRPMYFESVLESDDKNYWSGRSVGYSLQHLQEIYNKLWSALYTGVMSEAIPFTVVPSSGGLSQKVIEGKFGDVLFEPNLTGQPWSMPSKLTAAAALMNGIQILDRTGDQSARVSQNTMGSVVGGGTTATEQSIVGQGVAEGQSEYIANFTGDFPKMAKGTVELLRIHSGDWMPEFALRPMTQTVTDDAGNATEIPVPDPKNPDQPKMTGMIEIEADDLDSKCLWEVTGKTPSSTPQAKLQMAQLLLQSAATLPDCGGDVYEIFKLIVHSAGLSADQIQVPKDQLAGPQLLEQIKQMGIDPAQVSQALPVVVELLTKIAQLGLSPQDAIKIVDGMGGGNPAPTPSALPGQAA